MAHLHQGPDPFKISGPGHGRDPAMSIYFNLLFSQKLKIASKCIINAAKVNLDTDFKSLLTKSTYIKQYIFDTSDVRELSYRPYKVLHDGAAMTHLVIITATKVR